MGRFDWYFVVNTLLRWVIKATTLRMLSFAFTHTYIYIYNSILHIFQVALAIVRLLQALDEQTLHKQLPKLISKVRCYGQP